MGLHQYVIIDDCFRMASIYLAIAVLVLSLFSNYMLCTFGENKYSMASVSFSVFGLLYVCIGMISLLMIRHDSIYMSLTMPFELQNWGTITLWLLLFTTWASDTFAYFAGLPLVNVRLYHQLVLIKH